MSRVSKAALAAWLAIALAPAAPWAAERGPVTNLPLPRYVSLNTDRANIRRGPGLSHRIDWVFLRRGAPLRVIAEHGHWRRVVDQDEAGGWIHHALLRGARTAIVTAAPDVALREDPAPSAAVVARAETGVIGRLEECSPAWCRMEAGDEEGWLPKTAIWGVDPDEVFD